MSHPAEAAYTVLLVFFAVGILSAVYVALNGGDVGQITTAISALALPVTVVAILVFVALSVYNTASGR